MTIRGTHTRVHTRITFADPYLRCGECGQWVPAWHNPDRCGCGGDGWHNLPCRHQADIVSACPSWGPVDGCTCQPGAHAVPPAEVIAGRTT